MSAEGFLCKCGFEQTSENIGVRDLVTLVEQQLSSQKSSPCSPEKLNPSEIAAESGSLLTPLSATSASTSAKGPPQTPTVSRRIKFGQSTKAPF
jgi:hypothetical protein